MRLEVVIFQAFAMIVCLTNGELRTISRKLTESRILSEDGADGTVTAFKRINPLDGSYQFGYDTGPTGDQSFREEHRTPDGEVSGRYGYVDEHGLLRVTEYVAGRSGYRSADSIRFPVNPGQMTLYSLPYPKDHPLIGGLPVWPEEIKLLLPEVPEESELPIGPHTDDEGEEITMDTN